MKGEYKKGKQSKKKELNLKSSWFANVAKSIGRSSLDFIEETIPSIYDFNSYRNK